MKSLLYFSAILFIFTIGVSCTSSDDDFMTPAPTPNSTTIENPPVINTPIVNTPVVNSPVINFAVTTVDATFKADLKPITGVTSMASGNVTLQLDQTTKIIEINIVFSGIEPFLASIHRANGAFVFNESPYMDSLYNDEYIPFNSPLHFGRKLSDAEITELMNNQYYLVLHTIAYPNGEISGTFIKQ